MPKGRGAKRGELRGAARAGQGSASGARGGVQFGPPNWTPPSASHIGACGGPLTHAMTWAGCGVVLEVPGDSISMSGGSDVGSRVMEVGDSQGRVHVVGNVPLSACVRV